MVPTHKLHSARLAKGALDVCLVLGALAAIALLGWLVLAPFLMNDPEVRGDATIRVAIGESSLLPVVPVESTSDLASELHLVGGLAELRFETTSRTLVLVTFSGFLAALAVLLFVVWQLRAVVVTVLEGAPFAAANARRLRSIGVLLVAVGFAAPVAEYMLARWVLSLVSVEGLAVSPPIEGSATPIFAGLIVMVLAAVFEHGRRLEEDRSLTI